MAIATVSGNLPSLELRELSDVYGGYPKYLSDLDYDPKRVAKRLREIAEGMSE